MKPTSRVFNRPVLPEDALDLKCKLTAWRIAHYKKDLIEVKKPAYGRLGDIVSPLYSIALTFFPDKEKDFLRLLRKVELQKKEEATNTLEARLIEIISLMEGEVIGGLLKTIDVTKEFNKGKSERLSLSEDTIGKILTGLGFVKRRSAGARGFFYDPELITKLKLQYGIDDPTDTYDTDPTTSNSKKGESKNNLFHQIDIRNLPDHGSQESHQSKKVEALNNQEIKKIFEEEADDLS